MVLICIHKQALVKNTLLYTGLMDPLVSTQSRFYCSTRVGLLYQVHVILRNNHTSYLVLKVDSEPPASQQYFDHTCVSTLGCFVQSSQSILGTGERGVEVTTLRETVTDKRSNKA